MKHYFKRFIKNISPPILKNIYRAARFSSIIYPSYYDALREGCGYDEENITKLVISKGKKFSDQNLNLGECDIFSLNIFIGIALSFNKKNLTVIDFGGAAGHHFHIVNSLLSDSVSLDWRIVETSAMVNEAKIQGLETDRLKFFDNIDSASENTSVDFVFASSSLGYVPDPYDALAKLVKLHPKVLMITRTAISDYPCVLLQTTKLSNHGPRTNANELNIRDRVVKIPVTILERSKLESILSGLGEIVAKIPEAKGVYYSTFRSYDFWGYIVKNNN